MPTNGRYQRFDLSALKASDARTILSRYLPLKFHQRYATCLCPFHAEKTPSFYVFPNGYHCFSCLEHGDVIDFVMKIESIDFVTAVSKLGGAEVIDFSEAERRKREFLLTAQAREAEKDYRRAQAYVDQALYERAADPAAALEADWKAQQKAAEAPQLRELRNLRAEHDALGVQDGSTFDFEGLPPERYLVDGLLPTGTVCLFSGDESLGKSYLLLDLMVAAALGQKWLGMRTEQCKSLAWFCEDSPARIGWRLKQSLASRGADQADMEGRFCWSSREGKDSVLLNFNEKTETASPSNLWRMLQSHGYLDGPQILVLDTVPDIISGDPNRRRVAVNTIIFLTKWAVEHDAIVIAAIHPPKSAETEYAGARQWRTKPRVHLHLSRPMEWSKDERKMIPVGPKGHRLLTVSRSSYGESGKRIPIHWSQDMQIFTLDPYRSYE